MLTLLQKVQGLLCQVLQQTGTAMLAQAMLSLS